MPRSSTFLLLMPSAIGTTTSSLGMCSSANPWPGSNDPGLRLPFAQSSWRLLAAWFACACARTFVHHSW